MNSPSKALVPTIAAIGGVVVPAVVYVVLVRDQKMQSGWPIPTATDIAFALGVLALVGRYLPARVRALLLALAVIDDLIAILIIAFFFTDDLQLLPLLVALPVVAAFAVLSRRVRTGNRGILIPVLVAMGLAAWVLVYLSGVHATIAGVALGLVFATRNGDSVRHAVEPWSNAVVLPLFAFTATLVVLPDVTSTPLGPVFWAIVVALPVGKLIGITTGAALAQRLARVDSARIPIGDILTVASLGGIGFTVSLLMNELAFAGAPGYRVDGTLGVLAASVLSMIVGGTVATLRSRWYAVRGGR